MASATATATRRQLTAATADRHDLYQRSVQATEPELRFLARVFARRNRRPACALREDFCGTALLCADWVKSAPERTAIGVDLDEETLRYARRTHVAPLGRAAERVTLLRCNVLDPAPVKVDLTVAFNFSYCVFKTRAEILRYFASARRGLARGGGLVLDVYGGPDAQTELVEKKAGSGFTYVWEQEPLDAVTHCAWRHIHFRFPDGSEMTRAFSYDWRVWTLPEIIDALREVGFVGVDVYWEGADKKGEGSGIFRRVEHAENEQAWIAYVVAWR